MTRYDLAELHMKMKNYEKAEKVITTAMEEQKGTLFYFEAFALLITIDCSFYLRCIKNIWKIYGMLFFVEEADLASLMQESKLLVLLSKIHKKSLDMEENLNVLTRARDVQIR